MIYFSNPSNARRAARKTLGKSAREGVDYKLIGTDTLGGQVSFSPIVKARPAKGGGRNVTAEVRKVMGLSPAEIKTRIKANRSARRAKLKEIAGKPVSVFKAAADKSTRTFKTGHKTAKQNRASGDGAWLDDLIAMLARPKGATAAEVGKAFGWLEHTSRARISVGPRTRNMRATRTKEDRNGKRVSVYRVSAELPLGQKRNELGVLYVKPDRVRKAKGAA